MLQILDHEFDLVDGALSFHVGVGEEGWQSAMSLEVRARPRDARRGDSEAHLSTHSFTAPAPSPHALPGATLEVDDADEDGEPAFLLYIHEHVPLRAVRMSFGSWDVERIAVELTGEVDFEDDEGLLHAAAPLRLAAAIRFDGVTVDEGWPDKAEARLAQFFDRTHFEDPVRRPDGAHVFKRRITP